MRSRREREGRLSAGLQVKEREGGQVCSKERLLRCLPGKK